MSGKWIGTRLPRTGMIIVFALAAFAVGCSAAGGQSTGDSARGKTVADAHCASCHGADGNSTVPSYPRLAGQRADYLYAQLRAYRDGRRHSDIMAAMEKPLSDRELRDVAAYYAIQKRHSDPPGPSALMAQGRRLFLDGSADGRVAACASCHTGGRRGMGGMGMGGMRRGMHGMPMMGMRGAMGPVPILYGQHADYLLTQLHAYADGGRPSAVMRPIASAMTPRERQAVADYLAAHP